MKESIRIIALTTVVAVLFFTLGRITPNKGRRGGISKSADTLVVYRTHVVSEPHFKTQQLVRWAFFTEEQRDTVIKNVPVPYAVHDTVYVPIVQRYYEELDGRLRLWISGYQPTLVRFELDEMQTTIARQKKWGFSVVTGPTITLTPFHRCPIDAGWGLTGGISYTF